MKSFIAYLVALVATAIAVSAQNATVPTTTQTTSFQVSELISFECISCHLNSKISSVTSNQACSGVDNLLGVSSVYFNVFGKGFFAGFIQVCFSSLCTFNVSSRGH
jgi:hypothetical protein